MLVIFALLTYTKTIAQTPCGSSASYITCSSSLTLTSPGTAGYDYNWYETDGSGNNPVSVATTTTTYNAAPNTSGANETHYYLYQAIDQSTNSFSCQSGLITVIFEYELDITTSGGSTPTLTGGGNSLTYSNYQWYNGGTPISGAISISYMPTSSGIYTLHCTNSCNNTSISNPITFTGPNNQCSTSTQTIETCSNSYNLSFNPVAGYSLDWYSCDAAGQNMSYLSTSNSLTATPSSTSINETKYYVYVCTDIFSQATCTSAVITLVFDFVVDISSTNPTPSSTLSALPYSSLNNYSVFQWYKDGVAITGATNPTYLAQLPGVYYFTANTNNCGSRTSSTYTLTCGTNTYASSYLFPPGNTPISGQTVIFDGNVTIPSGAVVNISSSTVIMQQNSSITVLDNSGNPAVQGGQLILNGCDVSSCGDWQGIFVRGSSVAQSTDNGKLEIKGSTTIKNANIAVYGDNCARIHVEHSTFEDNYMHMQLNGFSNLNWNNTQGVNIDFDYCTFNALLANPTLSGLPNYVPAVINNSYRPMVYLYDVKDIDFRHCDWNCTNFANTPDQIGLDVLDAIGTNTINGLFVENCNFDGEFNAAIYIDNYEVAKIQSTTVSGDFYDGILASNGTDITLLNDDITHSSNGLGHTAFKMDQVLQGIYGANLYGNTFKRCINGMEYYYYSVNASSNVSVVDHNTFEENTYGLVFAPTCHPVGNVTCNNGHYSNNIGTITFNCDKFYNNDWGLVGVGDMTPQGDPAGLDWATFFGYYVFNNVNYFNFVSSSTYADIAWYSPNGAIEFYSQKPWPPAIINNVNVTYSANDLKFDNNASIILGYVNGSSNTIISGNVGTDWKDLKGFTNDNCWTSYKTDPNSSNGTGVNSKGNIIDSTSTAMVEIFPNPSSGIFNIKNPSKSTFNYYIYNMIGQVIDKGNITSEKTVPLNLNAEAKGCYTLILEPVNDANKRQIFRLIKNND